MEAAGIEPARDFPRHGVGDCIELELRTFCMATRAPATTLALPGLVEPNPQS